MIDLDATKGTLEDRVMDIIQRALAGYTDDYKHETQGRIYVRWGAVENDIRAAIASDVATLAHQATTQAQRAEQAEAEVARLRAELAEAKDDMEYYRSYAPIWARG